MAKKRKAKKQTGSGTSAKHNQVLQEHTTALIQHTNALNANTAALTAPTTAKNFVCGIFRTMNPAIDLSNPKKTPLAAYELDNPLSKDGLATVINQKHWHGVFVDNPTIEGCYVVQDVIDAVQKAMK
jgi:hypothetical protein